MLITAADSNRDQVWPTGMRLLVWFLIFVATLFLVSGGDAYGENSKKFQCYKLKAHTKGCTETVDSIVNLTIVSKDPNPYKGEYNAGFIQGRLHQKITLSARDNYWDMAYLTDPSHTFPKQIPPSSEELAEVQGILIENYNYVVDYIRNLTDPLLAENLKRLVFRLLGIYHGTSLAQPASLDFSGKWLPETSYFLPSELVLGYETPFLSFMDVYFINAYSDVFDVKRTEAKRWA